MKAINSKTFKKRFYVRPILDRELSATGMIVPARNTHHALRTAWAYVGVTYQDVAHLPDGQMVGKVSDTYFLVTQVQS